jgi:hypothetical protein
MEKYERVQRDMGDEAQRQETLLERIRVSGQRRRRRAGKSGSGDRAGCCTR